MLSALKLSGSAQSVLDVPKVRDALPTTPGLGDFLRSSSSDQVLLGTPNYVRRGELWECKQAPVDWFSVSIVPVFREIIERPPSSSAVDVRVLDASIEIEGNQGRSSIVGRAMEKVMSRASIEGLNAIRWSETADGWTLSGDISLALDVTPPRVFPVPRGVFERVGSGIMTQTCKQRGDAFLRDLAEGYAAWAASEDARIGGSGTNVP